jgi:hypothetical protein
MKSCGSKVLIEAKIVFVNEEGARIILRLYMME